MFIKYIQLQCNIIIIEIIKECNIGYNFLNGFHEASGQLPLFLVSLNLSRIRERERKRERERGGLPELNETIAYCVVSEPPPER